jgi:hypothetical protein
MFVSSQLSVVSRFSLNSTNGPRTTDHGQLTIDLFPLKLFPNESHQVGNLFWL